MTRVKGGKINTKRRRGILEHTKGFRWGRKSKIKLAKTAKMKAGMHAFVSRRTKKRTNRGLWNVRINAALEVAGLSYSKFIGALKAKNINLNRKMLAEIARDYPATFAKIIEAAK